MKRIILVLVLSMLVLLVGCKKNTPPVTPTNQPVVTPTDQQVVNPNFTKETYPRVDGSTATIPLSEGFASKLLNMTSEQAKSFIKHNTTHNAYVNLINGKADIIFVTEPSDEELKLAKEKNIELEVIPVVKDAFVFLNNTKNPVKSLTIQQIQDIYQGKITNWKQVGGNNQEIIAYQRTKNSGSQTIMENMVMKGLKLAEAPTELKPAEMEGLIESIAGYDNSERAIGYSVYYYANSMYTKDTIRLLGVNGVVPDKTTIKNNSYPYSSAYYAVINKSAPQDSAARKLLKWALSKEGQAVADASGYVPLK